MKQCSTCQEEFADKFSFCPVDGTPLVEHVEPPAKSPLPDRAQEVSSLSSHTDSYAAATGGAVAASSALALPVNEYHLTFIDDTGLTRRLMDKLKVVAHNSELTWPEFKRDPFGYSGRFVKGY
ncbi:MAG: hypothetical protein QOH63_739, partial [Acidobacteriota bacterium]|nr:hypothetical protein [Acidobacteriota bacterium]